LLGLGNYIEGFVEPHHFLTKVSDITDLICQISDIASIEV